MGDISPRDGSPATLCFGVTNLLFAVSFYKSSLSQRVLIEGARGEEIDKTSLSFVTMSVHLPQPRPRPHQRAPCNYRPHLPAHMSLSCQLMCVIFPQALFITIGRSIHLFGSSLTRSPKVCMFDLNFLPGKLFGR